MMISIAAGILVAGIIALLLISIEGRRLARSILDLAAAYSKLFAIYITIFPRLILVLPTIIIAATKAAVKIGKAYLEFRKAIALNKRLTRQVRRAFDCFTPLETLTDPRKAELESILRAIFAMEFQDYEAGDVRRSDAAIVLIATDFDKGAIRYGILTTRLSAVRNAQRNDMPQMKTADLLDAVLEDFAPKVRAGIKFRLPESSNHEHMSDAAILIQWLDPKSSDRHDAIRKNHGL